MDTQLGTIEQENSSINHKIRSVTVRDVSPKTFLPSLAQYLQESGKVNYEKLLPKISKSACNINKDYLLALQKWYYDVAASTLLQIYLHPCFQISYQKARGGSQASKLSNAQNIARATCLKELMEVGWIVKDRTGIILVSEEGIEKMDSISSQILQGNTKEI